MKDPAFLLYTSDFLTGTLTMTDDQVGKYIRLLCLQHQKGRLTEKDMLFICKSYDKDIFDKFIKTIDDLYYNNRLEEEINRRKKYSESRSNNRKSIKKDVDKPEENPEHMKNICLSYDEHMETETETIFNNWRNEYKVYLNYILCALENCKNDEEWISLLKKTNPDLDILKSLDKCVSEYWGTDEGWEKKKSNKNTKLINWKSTFSKTIKYHAVKKPIQRLAI